MDAADKKITYTAADVAILEETILKQKAEIEELKRKLEHMNTVLVKFPLYCPKCKKETNIDVVQLKMVPSK